MSGFEIKDKDKLPSATKVTCPRCKAQLVVNTYAQCTHLACGSCSSLYNANEGNLVFVKTFKQKYKAHIPVGSVGKLKGIKYKVVGFIQYREYKTPYNWGEYILFNPSVGYAFLSEYDGHWNLFEQSLIYPTQPLREFKFENYNFRLFHHYKQNVDYAEGEFHWNINPSDKPKITEYISPPYILSKEENQNEHAWFLGEYIEPAKLTEAFGLNTKLPRKEGVGATQPLSLSFSVNAMYKMTGIAAALLILCQIIFQTVCREEVILSKTYSVNESQSAFVTPSFEIKGGLMNQTNLLSEVSCDLHNDWLELNLTLINESTGEEIQFEQGIEYYYGYTGGENWSEGSRSSDQTLSEIPAGRYHMNILVHQQNSPTTKLFQYTLTADVSMWSNFFLSLLCLLILPGLIIYRNHNFERNRWMNSNFSPYE
ncbi:MAG: DUF4178 domain-containing protein [Cytophagaceae bacterium]